MTNKKSDNKAWWRTDCVRCQRWRLIVIWAVLMLVVINWWWF